MLWLPAQPVHTFPMMSYLWPDTSQLCCFAVDIANSVNIVHSYWFRAGCWANFTSGTAMATPSPAAKAGEKGWSSFTKGKSCLSGCRSPSLVEQWHQWAWEELLISSTWTSGCSFYGAPQYSWFGVSFSNLSSSVPKEPDPAPNSSSASRTLGLCLWIKINPYMDLALYLPRDIELKKSKTL